MSPQEDVKRSTEFDADFDPEDFFNSDGPSNGGNDAKWKRRRRRRWEPRKEGAPPPVPKKLLCSGLEDTLRRVWDVLKLGKEGPEWERYRMREYLLDAEVDLRAVFDWYRRAPLSCSTAVDR